MYLCICNLVRCRTKMAIFRWSFVYVICEYHALFKNQRVCRYIWRQRTIPVGRMFVKSLLRMSVWLLSREWLCDPIKRVSVWSSSRECLCDPRHESVLCDPLQESAIVIPDKNLCKKIKEETAYDPYGQNFQPLAIIFT